MSCKAAAPRGCLLLLAGVSCELFPFHRLDEILWEKAAVNCFINPLTAVLNCLNGQLADSRMQLARQVRAVILCARCGPCAASGQAGCFKSSGMQMLKRVAALAHLPLLFRKLIVSEVVAVARGKGIPVKFVCNEQH